MLTPYYAIEYLRLIYIDLIGPIIPKTKVGEVMFLIITNDLTYFF